MKGNMFNFHKPKIENGMVTVKDSNVYRKIMIKKNGRKRLVISKTKYLPKGTCFYDSLINS